MEMPKNHFNIETAWVGPSSEYKFNFREQI